MDEKHLKTAAAIGQAAEAKADKLWHRAPFIYTVLCGFAALMFLGGVWTQNLQGRVADIEKFVNRANAENLVEQVHANRDNTMRNAKQIRQLNSKVFGIPDPGED